MKILIMIISLLSLTGCWNYNELNDIAITTGLAIDKHEEGFEITVMIANSKKASSSDGSVNSQAAVYRGTGETIYEALKNAGMAVSKQLYFGHLELLALSEAIIEEGAKDVIDFLFRYPQVRNDFLLVIAKGENAGDIFEITTSLETFPSQHVSKNLMTSDQLQAITYNVNFNDFVTLLVDEGINPVLPSVEIIGSVEEGNKQENIEQSEPNTYLKLGTIGIFKLDKFVGYATEEQSKGISILNNKVTILGATSNCGDGLVTSEITESSSSFKVTDNKISVEVNMLGNLQETSCDININSSETIKEMEDLTKETIKSYVEAAIKFSQEKQTDIFGFGQYIFRHDYDYFKEIEQDWDSILYPSYEIEVKVKLDLNSKGNANNLIGVME